MYVSFQRLHFFWIKVFIEIEWQDLFRKFPLYLSSKMATEENSKSPTYFYIYPDLDWRISLSMTWSASSFMTESKALRPKPKSLRCFSANLLCSTQVDPSVSMIPRVLPLIPLTFSFHHHCSLPKVWQKICFTIGIQKN